MQEFRGEIRAVGPYERMQLWMDHEGLECFQMLQRLENSAIKLVLQVDFSLDTVAEP